MSPPKNSDSNTGIVRPLIHAGSRLPTYFILGKYPFCLVEVSESLGLIQPEMHQRLKKLEWDVDACVSLLVGKQRGKHRDIFRVH